MPITITIEAVTVDEARKLVNDLAGILPVISNEDFPVDTKVSTIDSPPAAQTFTPPAPVAPAAYAPPAVNAATYIPPAAVPTAPTSPSPVAPQAAVPTAPQTYTLDQLAVAATALMDAGKQNELLGLLNHFGVQALTALPKEQYGNFATALRSLGAKI